jgi:hypothetical protein
MAFGGLAIFFAGFFVRQPKINKLKKQIAQLQKEIKRLEALREEQNNTINRLLINYKSLKLFDFAKRSKSFVNDVTLSVVDHDLSTAEIETCRSIADSCGVSFRIRKYID